MESVDIWEPFLLSSKDTWVAIAVQSVKKKNERTLNSIAALSFHACMTKQAKADKNILYAH